MKVRYSFGESPLTALQSSGSAKPDQFFQLLQKADPLLRLKSMLLADLKGKEASSSHMQ